MTKKQFHSISLLLALVFLLPSFMQLGHHGHELPKTLSGTENINQTQNKCAVCNFEFSVFYSPSENNTQLNNEPVAGYCNHYTSIFLSSYSDYSFLLRAPPYKQM